jgi:hypothetical protein
LVQLNLLGLAFRKYFAAAAEALQKERIRGRRFAVLIASESFDLK